jgi:hypothetical protein
MASPSREASTESPRLDAARDRSAPLAPDREYVSEADLERAIVVATLDGRGDVAELLARALKARRAARAGNVIDLGMRRR